MATEPNPVLSLNPAEFYEGPALQAAQFIRTGRLEDLRRMLVAKQLDPNTRGLKGMPLLVWAAGHRNNAAVALLMDHGADGNIVFEAGRKKLSFIGLAVGIEDPGLLQVLIKHKVNLDGVPPTEPPLFTAIHAHHWDRFVQLLDSGAHINQPNSAGFTPVMELAVAKQFDRVWWMLERGADPKAKSEAGAGLIDCVRNASIQPSQSQAKWRDKLMERLK
jgi:uncharacterized protein